MPEVSKIMSQLHTSNAATTSVTFGLLALTGIVSFVLPDELSVPLAAAQAGPATIRLPGTVRDFSRSHPDFNNVPAGGYGHYAGNVEQTLSADGRPVFNEPGIQEGGGTEDIDLIAHWKFDEGAGGTAGDAVGDNHGTLIGDTSWTSGRVGEALRFDGTGDYVEIPNSPEMQIKGDITFAGWFKLDSGFNEASPDTLVVMEKFLDVDHDFHIALAGVDYNRPEVPKGSLVFKVENGPTSDYYCYVWTNRTGWNTDTWYHFACVLQSSNTSQNRIFINGVDDTDSTIAAGVGFLDTDYDAPMRIGGKTIDYNGFASDIYFEGVIDDVMIFRRILTETDFSGGDGFKVDAEWENSDGHPIAPHLFRNGRPERRGISALAVDESAVIKNQSLIDSYDSSLGPYGGTNVGQEAVISTNLIASKEIEVLNASDFYGDALAGPGGDPGVVIDTSPNSQITGTLGVLSEAVSMPVIEAPTDLGPSIGDVVYESGVTTITGDMHVDKLEIKSDAKVVFDGDVIVLCENDVKIEGNGLEVRPGSLVQIYAKKQITVKKSCNVAAGFEPSSLVLLSLGNDRIEVNGQNAVLAARIIAPEAELKIKTGGVVYGSFTGKKLDLDNKAELHVDISPFTWGEKPVDACDNLIVDVAGTAGVDSDGGITSAETFASWFRDKMGTNLSTNYTITLTDDGTGVYEYLDDDFRPVDDMLLGNEGEARNNYFTYSIATTCVYETCGNQFLEFQGADDAWAFIDGRLVLDIGGVLPAYGQRIDLDRLGLVDGERYTFHFFYAQRQSNIGSFRLRTNILFAEGGATVASGGWD